MLPRTEVRMDIRGGDCSVARSPWRLLALTTPRYLRSASRSGAYRQEPGLNFNGLPSCPNACYTLNPYSLYPGVQGAKTPRRILREWK